jgi:hypothetical protein
MRRLKQAFSDPTYLIVIGVILLVSDPFLGVGLIPIAVLGGIWLKLRR